MDLSSPPSSMDVRRELTVAREAIDAQLARRQKGYGRGERQSIEKDTVEIVGGVRHGYTTGAPIALVIRNRDAANWGDVLAPDAPPAGGSVAAPSGTPAHDFGAGAGRVAIPRPGHADLGGALLYDHEDIRDVIERASARETAARVACGTVARELLAAVGCRIGSHVVAIGEVASSATLSEAGLAHTDDDPVRCLDPEAAAAMRARIDAAAAAGDTVGGVVEVAVFGFPPGVGSYIQGDQRLGSRLAAAVLSVPAMRGVEIGLGFHAARLPGSQAHDPITWDAAQGYSRISNKAGGIEGGISTGAPIVLRAAMKPISTLRRPLATVELGTHEAVESRYERADVCAVPAAGIVLEAVIALTLADALMDRFGGATVADVIGAIEAFRARVGDR